MSRYSDKRARRPLCRAHNCGEPAVELRILSGVLGWYCVDHRQDGGDVDRARKTQE